MQVTRHWYLSSVPSVVCLFSKFLFRQVKTLWWVNFLRQYQRSDGSVIVFQTLRVNSHVLILSRFLQQDKHMSDQPPYRSKFSKMKALDLHNKIKVLPEWWNFLYQKKTCIKQMMKFQITKQIALFDWALLWIFYVICIISHMNLSYLGILNLKHTPLTLNSQVTGFFLILSDRPRDGYKSREALAIPDHNLDFIIVVMTCLSYFPLAILTFCGFCLKGNLFTEHTLDWLAPKEKKRKD